MKPWSAVAFVSGLFLATTTGNAQTWTGTRLKGNQPAGLASEGDHSDITARMASGAVATARLLIACAVKFDRPSAIAFLNSRDAKSKGGQRFLIDVRNCMAPTNQTASMKFGGRDLRELVAEAVLRSEKLQPTTPFALSDVKYDEKTLSSDPGDRATEMMAICVAATRPKETMNLLLTEPGTSTERDTFAVILPALGPCLSSNSKMKANRDFIRLALAEAFYYQTHQFIESSAVARQSKTDR